VLELGNLLSALVPEPPSTECIGKVSLQSRFSLAGGRKRKYC
jgi:hypothetical protein